MPNFPEPITPDFVPVYQIQRTDPVDAGAAGEGPSNLPIKNLVERTAYLKKEVDDLDTALGGVVIGSTVQAYDDDLAAIAALNTTGIIDRTGAGTAATRATGATGLAVLASADAATARTAIAAAPLDSPTFTGSATANRVGLNKLAVGDNTAISIPANSLIHLNAADRNNGISWLDFAFTYASFIQSASGVLELGARQSDSVGADSADPQIRIRDRTVEFPSVSTTASGANAFLSGTERKLFVSTSSLRYKKDIEPVEEPYADAILDLQAVYYRSASSADNPDWSWWGFIAEDVFKIDPRLVTYIEDPEDPDKLIPDGVQYDRISVLLQDVVKRQSLKISELEQKIHALEQQMLS